MEGTNAYCDELGIRVSRIEDAAKSADANYYSLLIVTLLEAGVPMTLEAVAERFEAAGIARAERALRSLKRCKPGRSPVYRVGELYALDPYDDETDLWAFRLGLKPPQPRIEVVRPDPEPLPTVGTPLTIAHLDEAWRGGIPTAFSALRVVVCVLDAHRRAMSPREIIAFIEARSRWPVLSAEPAYMVCRGSPIGRTTEGRWKLIEDHDAIHRARAAVIERLAVMRRNPYPEPSAADVKAHRERYERERAARAYELSRLSRVVIHAFSEKSPEAVVLIDERRRHVDTYVGSAVGSVAKRLDAYDFIAAVDVRSILRNLEFDPGKRRLGELGPSQKTKMLQSGRVLRITLDLLVQSSCGIRRPFSNRKALLRYLRDGRHDALRTRLESDAKSLFALYTFGRVHGWVRLRWRSIDTKLKAPWVHLEEWTLFDLMKQAQEQGAALDVVLGEAPELADPWARAERVFVRQEAGGWGRWLVDERGYYVDSSEVQLARVGRDALGSH